MDEGREQRKISRREALKAIGVAGVAGFGLGALTRDAGRDSTGQQPPSVPQTPNIEVRHIKGEYINEKKTIFLVEDTGELLTYMESTERAHISKSKTTFNFNRENGQVTLVSPDGATHSPYIPRSDITRVMVEKNEHSTEMKILYSYPNHDSVELSVIPILTGDYMFNVVSFSLKDLAPGRGAPPPSTR